MEESTKEYRVKYYRSTHPCVMTLSFTLIAFVITRIAANYTIPHDENWMVYCAIGLFVLGAGFFYNDRRARIVCVPLFCLGQIGHAYNACPQTVEKGGFRSRLPSEGSCHALA